MRERQRRALRAKKIKRNRMIAAATVVTILLLCITIGSIVLKTEAADEQASYKYYTEVFVDRDCSLWSLARKYMSQEYDSQQSYIDEICSINNIYDESIEYGQRIVVPYYSSEIK